jgi:N-dimethylarginine dimethylaminohydrolase
MSLINQTVLMSGAKYFRAVGNNPYSRPGDQPNIKQAVIEHHTLKARLQEAGLEVIVVDPPHDCVDGVYTANWGLCRGNKVITSSLPVSRKEEEPAAHLVFQMLGKTIIEAPYRFSGQGDALPCGDLCFIGSTYRTDPKMHNFVTEKLGYKVIGLETVPKLDSNGRTLINPVTGWPDSFFYDLDLALAVIKFPKGATKGLVAWCPEAFTPESQQIMRALKDVDRIEVNYDEAIKSFACNLVSTGETVIMTVRAPQLQAALETHGLKTVTLDLPELTKGGGFIRCTSLTLDNV